MAPHRSQQDLETYNQLFHEAEQNVQYQISYYQQQQYLMSMPMMPVYPGGTYEQEGYQQTPKD